nr:immunoglobulin heavy chain junction region [Macaca mulatta]MOW79731.1 immunoglobulin heavy chain junction region [Macaca mulatta]MOW80994.1 immunoglobulin heavy chain junction region [Macaca mulatta]MOW81124.1 immunoglobulin heavy chain junction region [Macaca mulatta]MOW85474.1 immunoglobulin heavy chain junction region [Macaca mulatta]
CARVWLGIAAIFDSW